jgi:hypothetical protein
VAEQWNSRAPFGELCVSWSWVLSKDKHKKTDHLAWGAARLSKQSAISPGRDGLLLAVLVDEVVGDDLEARVEVTLVHARDQSLATESVDHLSAAVDHVVDLPAEFAHGEASVRLFLLHSAQSEVAEVLCRTEFGSFHVYHPPSSLW